MNQEEKEKEQEREVLHRAIWAIAEELRGSVDGWDFRNYVLGAMFYRYISENIADHLESDYVGMSDDDAQSLKYKMIEEKGFLILPSELFCNVTKRVNAEPEWAREHLGETLRDIFQHIEDSATGTKAGACFAGLFDDFDINSNKLGSTVTKRNETLIRLLNGIASMSLGSIRNHNIDAFGDAYEYLMAMYAGNAGKSGGEFFTPAEVSELLTRLGTVGKTEINSVYDPACGSGSLLLKSAEILGKDNVKQGFFGQEINVTTYNLCRINMLLHEISFEKFHIACEDTLTSPQHLEHKPFELIVSNPPYSIRWEGDSNPELIRDPRFTPAGVLAPKARADLAFIMHALSSLADNGTAVIVCFPGTLFRRGAEKKIRKYLVDNHLIDCIIQLPDHLFFSTSIATCILILKKNRMNRIEKSDLFFIDASRECVRVRNYHKLTARNIDRIVSIFSERKNIPHVARLVSYDEIVQQAYHLSVSTYIEPEAIPDAMNITELNSRISEVMNQENKLYQKIAGIISELDSQE